MLGLEFIVRLKEMEFKDIAEMLEITPQTVSSWINGKRKIPKSRKNQLSQIFDVESELIDRELTEDDKLRIHYKFVGGKNEISNKKKSKNGKTDYSQQLSLALKSDFITLSDLVNQIGDRRKEIKINESKVMISTLYQMYADRKVIDVHPEFQRLFRWTIEQKSRFIESILIGIPIPPIFIAEKEDMSWDVIDGVQRLSTIFEFLGILRNDEDELLPPSILSKTETLPSLEGKVWDNSKFNKEKFCFKEDKFLENVVLNASLSVITVSRDSDAEAKYDIFDRLNTGGARLTDQEVRNCLAIMLNRDFYKWLRALSYNPDFIDCLPLTEKEKNEQEDLEYVLRFMVYRNLTASEFSNNDDIHKVLTNKMKLFCKSDSFNYSREKEIFDKTFELLRKATGEDSFKKFNLTKDKFNGAVTISSFEIIALGVAENLENILTLSSPVEFIRKKIKILYNHKDYLTLQNQKIASQRAMTRLKKLKEFGKKYFCADVQ